MSKRFRRVDDRGLPCLLTSGASLVWDKLADQAWDWNGSWQKGELAVDEHVAAGRVKVVENVDEFLDAMANVREKRKRTA
jgi:hypothetical protein